MLADGPIGRGDVARGGRLFARNFILERSIVLTEAERTSTKRKAALVTRSLPSA